MVTRKKISALAPCRYAWLERERFQHELADPQGYPCVRRTRALHGARFATGSPDVADTDSLRLRNSYAGGWVREGHIGHVLPPAAQIDVRRISSARSEYFAVPPGKSTSRL